MPDDPKNMPDNLNNMVYACQTCFERSHTYFWGDKLCDYVVTWRGPKFVGCFFGQKALYGSNYRLCEPSYYWPKPWAQFLVPQLFRF